MFKFGLIPLILLSMLIPASVSAAELTIEFERTYESPVSLEFRVTVTNAGSKADIPLNVFFQDLITDKTIDLAVAVSIERVYKETVIKETPIYVSVERSYTPVGVSKITETTEGVKTFSDVGIIKDKDGKETVYYSGEFERYENGVFYWTEQIYLYTQYNDVVYEVSEPIKEWAKYEKSKTSVLSVKSKDDYGWGEGVHVYDVVINTGLLTTSGGWGSSGVMVWEVEGKKYYDKTNSSWWQTAWLYRQRIDMDTSSISSSVSDFPVMFLIDDTVIDMTKVQSDGDDIRFISGDGLTNLSYELVTAWDSEGVNEVHVKVPTITGTDDYIWVYYGNASASAGANPTDVWSNGYAAVYHMNDKPSDSTMILDSTSNANHGTKGAGAAAPTEVDGLFGKAQSFDGGDYIDIPDHPGLKLTTNMTLEAYFKQDILGTQFILFKGSGATTATQQYGYYASGTTVWQVYISDGTATSTQSTVTQTTNQVYYTVTYNNTQIIGYLDGVENGARTNTTRVISTDDSTLRIGARINATAYLDGLISSIRISSVARNADWIALTDATLRGFATFASFGAVEGKPEPPTNLTVTKSGNNVIVTWDDSVLATGMILVKGNNAYPTSVTDGEVVNIGLGVETYTDYNAVSEFSTNYYAIFGESDWGYSDPGLIKEGGIMVFLAVLLVAGSGLLVASYALGHLALRVTGGFVFMLSAFAAFGAATGYDIYYWAGFGLLFMSFMFMIDTYTSNRRNKAVPESNDDEEYKPPKRIKLTSSRVAEIRRRQEFNRIANRNQSIVNQQRRGR